MERFILNTKYFILNTLVFLFPFFFLPFTQEYFVFNKFYLLIFVALILLILYVLDLIIKKKIDISFKKIDIPIIFFFGAVILSFLISSTNKIQALFNPSFGPIMFFGLIIIYFSLSRSRLITMVGMNFVSFFLSIITIILFFLNKNIYILGNVIDLLIYLGLFTIIHLYFIFSKKISVYQIVLSIFNLIALCLTVYQVFKNDILVLPPLNVSWYASLEILKNIRTALFGVGIENFSIIFTKVKTFDYNQTRFWQISSFNFSSSTILHILTETGLSGILAFGLIIYYAFKRLLKGGHEGPPLHIYLFVYLIICLSLLPPSLPLFFLFFVVLSYIASGDGRQDFHKSFNLENRPTVIILVVLFLGIITASLSYPLGRYYLAEYYFKKSVDSIYKNNARDVYNNMRQARILNPHNEKYILNFSQTNMIIAQSLTNKNKEISDVDRQTISQAIQAAISEAKALIRLNPEKAQYYENLANVYKSIITVAEGADAWTISSLQRAIILDPKNPNYLLNLGGIYYLLGQYSEASKYFEQAVSLKPNWPNAYYNLAWNYYQNKEYDRAVNAMQNVVNLIDKTTAKSDYNKAVKVLEDFKSKLEEIQNIEAPGSELKLPEVSPVATIEPKLDLPPEASPEAK